MTQDLVDLTIGATQGTAFVIAIGAALLACSPHSPELRPSQPSSNAAGAGATGLALDLSTESGLARLGRAIGDRRVVLLGENGHGVAESTTLKARLVRYLHGSMGFKVVAIESGFFECATAQESIARLTPALAARQCLGYAFEHREILPLFEYLRDSAGSPTGLRLSGIDLQVQANDSRDRPARLHQALRRQAPGLADTLAGLDSLLLARLAGEPALLRDWIRADGPDAQRQYVEAAGKTTGDLHWTLRTTGALLGRLLTRDTLPAGTPAIPAAFWQLRDEWMAETVLWLADSSRRKEKVIVWLHNDHARYGSWMTPGGPAVAAGGLLRRRLPGQVFSIGFFLGGGKVASNSRQIREIPPETGELERLLEALLPSTAPGALLLPGSPSGDVAPWGRMMSYLRNGLALDSLIPEKEFDALVYLPRVAPPSYIE